MRFSWWGRGLLPVAFAGDVRHDLPMDEPGVTWFTGPAEDRRRYAVASPEPLPGGQGFVFEAEQVAGEPTAVSLKLMEDADSAMEERIKQRWSIVTAAPHPRLALPVEVFRGPGLFTGNPPPLEDSDLLYGSTAWVPGASLRSLAPLSADQVAVIIQDLSAALAHLHDSCGLVHRDVHPGNVIVGSDGHATLIDLGAARPPDDDVTTTVAGVLGFIPPERTEGPGDRRSDAWGLGMVAAFALLGHPIGHHASARLEEDLERVLGTSGRTREAARLISRMTATDPAARPVDLVGWSTELATALQQPAHRMRRRWAAAAMAATVLTAAAVSALAFDRGGTDDASPAATPTSEVPATGTECSFPIGAPEPGLTEGQVQSVQNAVPQLEALRGSACGTSPASLFGEAVHQAISEDGSSEQIIVSPVGAVRVSAAEWASYQEIAGRQRPENAITFGGYPISADTNSSATLIELSNGGVVLGRRDDTQSFWMPEAVLDRWLEHGGADGALGYPMTNPFYVPEGVRQDFEGGFMELPASTSEPVAAIEPSLLLVQLTDQPETPLVGVELEGKILRQPTGTAWWIDGDGRRRWLPDGSTYTCVGGDEIVVADDLPGSAVATVPLGPPATCEEAS